MARTLSEDLRGRVIAAVEAGATRRGAAERFGIGVATAIRWVRVFRTTGTSSAQPKGGDLRSHRIEAFRGVVLHAIVVGAFVWCKFRERVGDGGPEVRDWCEL